MSSYFEIGIGTISVCYSCAAFFYYFCSVIGDYSGETNLDGAEGEGEGWGIGSGSGFGSSLFIG